MDELHDIFTVFLMSGQLTEGVDGIGSKMGWGGMDEVGGMGGGKNSV